MGLPEKFLVYVTLTKGTRISCRKPFEKKNATIGSEVPTCLIFDSELLRIVSRLFICWTVHNVHPKYQRFISLTPKLTRQLQLQHSTEDRACTVGQSDWDGQLLELVLAANITHVQLLISIGKNKTSVRNTFHASSYFLSLFIESRLD